MKEMRTKFISSLLKYAFLCTEFDESYKQSVNSYGYQLHKILSKFDEKLQKKIFEHYLWAVK